MGRLSKLISRFAVGIVFVSLLSSAFIGLEPQKAKADGPPSCSGTPPAGAGGQPATIQLTSLTDSSEGIKVNILFSHLYVVSQNSINHAVINIYRGTESGGTVNWDKRYNIESNNLDITNQIKTTPAGSTGPYTTQGYYYDKTGLTKGSVYHYMVIGKAPTGGNGSNDGCVISGEQNITYQGSGIEPPSPVPCPTGVKLAGDSLVAPTSGANPKTVTLAWSMSSEPSGVKYKIVNGSGGTENIKGADGQAGDSVSTKQATIQRLVSPTGEVTVPYTVIAFTPDGKESTGCKAISIKYGADGVIAFTDQSGAVTSIGYSAYTNKAQTIGRCGKGPNMNDGITGGIMETMKYAFCVVVDWIYQLSVKFLYGAVGLLSETSGIASSIGKAEDREKTTFFSGVIPCELKSVNLANKLIAAASINAPSGACTSGGAIGKVVVNAHTMVLGMVNFLVLIIFIVIALANVLQIQMQNYQIKKLLPGLLVGFVIANFSLFFIRASLEVQGQLTDSIFKIKYSDVITDQETEANSSGSGITTTTNDSVRSAAPTIDYKDIVDATKENGINEAKLREKMAAAAAEEAKYCKKTYDLSCFVSSVAAVGGNAAMPMFKVVKGDKGTFLSALTNTIALAGIPAVGPSMAIYNMYSYFTSDNIYTVVIFDLVVQQAILNVFVIAAAVMIFVLGFLFMLRPIVFYFLTPLAPLGMLLMFIPQFKSTGDKWWKTFVGWLFMPTVSVFWLWLGFMWVRALADVQAAAFSSATSVYLPPITAFFTYAFALFCIYMAMKTPFSMAGEAKDLINKWNTMGKKAWGSTGGGALKGAKNMMISSAKDYTAIGANKLGYSKVKNFVGDYAKARKTAADASGEKRFQGRLGQSVIRKQENADAYKVEIEIANNRTKQAVLESDKDLQLRKARVDAEKGLNDEIQKANDNLIKAKKAEVELEDKFYEQLKQRRGNTITSQLGAERAATRLEQRYYGDDSAFGGANQDILDAYAELAVHDTVRTKAKDVPTKERQFKLAHQAAVNKHNLESAAYGAASIPKANRASIQAAIAAAPGLNPQLKGHIDTLIKDGAYDGLDHTDGKIRADALKKLLKAANTAYTKDSKTSVQAAIEFRNGIETGKILGELISDKQADGSYTAILSEPGKLADMLRNQNPDQYSKDNLAEFGVLVSRLHGRKLAADEATAIADALKQLATSSDPRDVALYTTGGGAEIEAQLAIIADPSKKYEEVREAYSQIIKLGGKLSKLGLQESVPTRPVTPINYRTT